MDEIKTTMGAHGMSIDERHTMLLADCMTYKVGGLCVCLGARGYGLLLCASLCCPSLLPPTLSVTLSSLLHHPRCGPQPVASLFLSPSPY